MGDIVKNKNMRRFNKVLDWALIAGFIVILIPFFVTIRYSLCYADDFPLANGMRDFSEYNMFIAGLKCAKRYWNSTNGTWFSFVIGYALNPLLREGQTSLVVELRMMFLLEIIGGIYLLYAIAYTLGMKKEKTLRIMFLVMGPLLLFKEYYELYLWWTTACTYMMPTFLFMFGWGTLLIAIKRKKVWQYICSAVLLFAMAGGTLNVVGAGCYLVLLTTLVLSYYQKKLHVPSLIVTITTALSACITAFAPGNFRRYDSQGVEKISILKSWYNTFLIVGVETKWLLLKTFFIAFLIVGCIWGYRQKKTLKLREVVILCVFSALLPFVTAFPVVLGYNATSYKQIANRGYAIMDMSLVFSLMLIAVIFGIYLRNKLDENFKKITIIFLSGIAILNVGLAEQKPSTWVPIEISKNLHSGYIKDYYEAWESIYTKCEEYEGEDLVIEMVVPDRKTGCSNPRLKEDNTDWKNMHVAKYYGLNTVSLISQME